MWERFRVHNPRVQSLHGVKFDLKAQNPPTPLPDAFWPKRCVIVVSSKRARTHPTRPLEPIHNSTTSSTGCFKKWKNKIAFTFLQTPVSIDKSLLKIPPINSFKNTFWTWHAKLIFIEIRTQFIQWETMKMWLWEKAKLLANNPPHRVDKGQRAEYVLALVQVHPIAEEFSYRADFPRVHEHASSSRPAPW